MSSTVILSVRLFSPRHGSGVKPDTSRRFYLIDTGRLRRSVSSRTTENSITFYTDLSYAAIHNDGGEIRVTKKMKRYFWHKYYEATGSFGRRKNGEKRKDKRTVQLTGEAEFWKFMALKRRAA